MKTSTTPDSIFNNRPDYTCPTCRKWVFRNRKIAKNWVKVEHREQRVVRHACGEGFTTETAVIH